MSNDMKEVVSYRTTKDKKQQLEEVAKKAGCHSLSEYARRRVEDNEADSIRKTLSFIQDLALSCVAFNNLNIEINQLDAGKVKSAMDEYKVSIIQAWNEKNGIK